MTQLINVFNRKCFGIKLMILNSHNSISIQNTGQKCNEMPLMLYVKKHFHNNRSIRFEGRV